MRWTDRIIILTLIGVCFGLIFAKAERSGRSAADVLPEWRHALRMDLHVTGSGGSLRLAVAVPPGSPRQQIHRETFVAPGLSFEINRQGPNRTLLWQVDRTELPRDLVYSCTLHTVPTRFVLASVLPVAIQAPEGVGAMLTPASDDPDRAAVVESLFQRFVPTTLRTNATAVVRAAYDASRRASGTDDALVLTRHEVRPAWGSNSNHAAVTLLVALLRRGGVPARRVAGLVLGNATRPTPHEWVDAWVGGYWVPLCPTSGHFAELPAGYVVLRYGDGPVIVHGDRVNVTYRFHDQPQLVPSSAAGARGWVNPLAVLQRAGAPANLLLVLLLLPLGGCVVVVGRNIVGLKTFGTFLPALLAVGFRETGLLWGMLLFAVVLTIGAVVRYAAQQLQLLRTPQLGILLTVIVIAILGIVWAGGPHARVATAGAMLFPLVITALTVERFMGLAEEEGIRRALYVTLSTVALTAVVYWVLAQSVLQRFVLAFPETLLLAIAFFILVGRWRGMRLLEYVRFREFLWYGSRNDETAVLP